MVFNEEFYARYQAGSTNVHDESAKALLKGAGPIARSVHGILRFPSDLPTIVLGGAGSGKCANLGAMQFVHPSTESFFSLDPGGQFTSLNFHYNLQMGRAAYTLNPHKTGLYPDLNHPVHLFSILKDDEKLFDRARKAADMALTNSDKEGKNAWVRDDAIRWLTRILTSIVRLEGRVTPKRMWEVINLILTDDEFLTSWGRACADLPNQEYSCFLQMYQAKGKTSGEAFNAPISKMLSDLDWLSSEEIAESISGDDAYFEKLGDPSEKIAIYFQIEGGTTEENQSFVRFVVGIAQLNCVYANMGALPLFYLEECATCGNASFIRKAASEYRKYFRTVFIYQSLGQLSYHLGEHGATEILESCAYHIYLGGGIRAIKSAREIAEAIGKTTINVDPMMEQADRVYRAERALRNAYWYDIDLVEAAREYEHELQQSHTPQQIGRDAIAPAELTRLKDDVLILAPGMGIQPALAKKLPNYWDNPAMAGRYAPDPLFPPLDRVRIKRKLLPGHATHKFIRCAVPEHLADWPNHINGEIAYVQGYRTW